MVQEVGREHFQSLEQTGYRLLLAGQKAPAGLCLQLCRVLLEPFRDVPGRIDADCQQDGVLAELVGDVVLQPLEDAVEDGADGGAVGKGEGDGGKIVTDDVAYEPARFAVLIDEIDIGDIELDDIRPALGPGLRDMPGMPGMRIVRLREQRQRQGQDEADSNERDSYSAHGLSFLLSLPAVWRSPPPGK
jgi:hypothetical protein